MHRHSRELQNKDYGGRDDEKSPEEQVTGAVSELDPMRADVVQIAGLKTGAASNQGRPVCIQSQGMIKARQIQGLKRCVSIYCLHEILHPGNDNRTEGKFTSI